MSLIAPWKSPIPSPVAVHPVREFQRDLHTVPQTVELWCNTFSCQQPLVYAVDVFIVTRVDFSYVTIRQIVWSFLDLESLLQWSLLYRSLTVAARALLLVCTALNCFAHPQLVAFCASQKLLGERTVINDSQSLCSTHLFPVHTCMFQQVH